jgi:hypothetical protein
MALYQFIGRNDEAVFIVDEDRPDQPSITNAAEKVCREVVSCWGNKRIIYRDTMGRWDELDHRNGNFIGYSNLSDRDRQRFQEWLIPIGEKIG